MPAVPTSSDRYALGRNSLLGLSFRSKTYSNNTWIYSDTYDTTFYICISDGSVSLDTDTIEINSNCQSGWKLKLPSMKSGTVSGTGYIAVSGGLTAPVSIDNQYNLLRYLGDFCQIAVEGNVPEQGGESAFYMDAMIGGEGNGFFKTASVTISPDDALRVAFTIELSGEQSLKGLIATSELS